MTSTIRRAVPLRIGKRSDKQELADGRLQDVRIYSRVLQPAEVKSLGSPARMAWLLSKPALQRTGPEKDELYETWLPQMDSQFQKAQARLARPGRGRPLSS